MNKITISELFKASIDYTPIKIENKSGNSFHWEINATFCGAPIEISVCAKRKKDIAQQVNDFIEEEVSDLFTCLQWRDVNNACEVIEIMQAYVAMVASQ